MTPERLKEIREHRANGRRVSQYEVDDLLAHIDALEADRIPPLNDVLKDILGRVSFTVAHVARRLHALRLYDVERRAEAEQAAALHWMLTLYFKHGDGWMAEGEKILSGDAALTASAATEPKP